MPLNGAGRGRFITFEGGEGAGKSTQCARLAARLNAAGIETVQTREPGGSPKAEAIRALLLKGAIEPHGPAAEALMFAAARIDHLDSLIGPALAAERWVICDRFADSTRAYQGALGGISSHLIDALEAVTLGATRPDLTLILDLPVEDGLARAGARAGQGAAADRFEKESLSFHRAVRAAFLDIAGREPVRCAVIDAGQPSDTVAERVWSAVRLRLLENVAFPHRAGRRQPAEARIDITPRDAHG